VVASNALATVAATGANEKTRRRLHTKSFASHTAWLWQSKVVPASNASAVAIVTAIVPTAAA
jgi:hypothetical protein